MIRLSRMAAVSVLLLLGCGRGTPDRSPAAARSNALLAPGFTGSTTYTHQYAAAVVLDDGRVLAADNTISETYDPATNQWTAAGTMSFRYFHVLVKLPSGRVLAAGGEGGSTSFIQSSAQIFDPQTRTWTDATPMTTPRARALATRLADGRVLVVGGWDSSEIAVSSAEVYDAVAGTWTPIGAANHPYQEGTATLLNDGRVLLVGPYGADVYDPVAGTFTSVPADNRFRHIAALLQNGKVLLTGGTVNTSQIFDPATNSVGPVAPMAKATRWFAAGTTISDGTVLIAGGYDVAGHTLDSIERYDPASNTWFIHDPLALQRESAVMVPLASGEALVIGGSYRTGPGISMVIPASQGAEIVDSSCTPTSCGAQNASCGSLSDGCGGTLSCGTCSTGLVCTANACVAACTPASCAAQNASCGSVSDGCGGTLSCGTCSAGQVCSATHACVQALAQYDATYRVPRCPATGTICDSGMLLNGRASLGPEANAPNTIGSTCADGASGTYHSDESLDRLVIQSVDGTDLAAGKTARISATVWAYAGFSSDRLDLYSSPSADSPSWTLLATLTPTAASAQTLSTTFTLPFSPRQAIRGVFRYGGTAAPCSGGPFDDHDDLVFEVVVPPDTVAPTASITSPANGASLIPPVQVSVQGSDDRGVTRLELYEGTTLLGAFNAGTGSLTLNPGLGSHTYTALAYDAAGNVGTSAPVTFTAVPDTAPPTISITYPNPAQTVAGDVPVMANASDNVGVTRVEFYDGSSLYWTATTPPWNGVLHTFNLPNGAHTVRAIAYDAAGNSGSAAVDFVVNNDHTAPDVAVTSPVAGSFIAGIVTLTASATDNVGVTRVEFSENGILIGQATQTSGTSTWTLKWDTGSIADGLVLTLTARAWDGAGNSATSPGVTVTKKDVVAPSTTVTSPGAGATISGTVNIVATATDDVKVTRLEFYDGAIYLGLANSIAGSTYSLAWNTKTVANGGHSLFTKAYDAAGNVATSGVVAVTVNNDLTPPSTTLTSPADGATVQDVIMLSAVATDDVGVQTVRFKIDGTTVIASGTQTGGTTSWTASWSSWGAANGTHTVASEAVDTSGNLASSAPVSITVSNVDTTPPMTAITSPATGATLSGTVTLVASASDNVGVTRVEFWDGATLLGAGSRSGTSYSFAWNTSGAASGSHSLTSRAYDAANNVGPSAAVSVNVATAPPPPPARVAAYDAVRKAPACASVGSSCDSGTLLNGRAAAGPESNAPNTIASSCADGASGVYHSDESLDRLKVSTLDGSALGPGKTVRIDATVWAYAGFTSDHLDLYSAANAASPSWIFIGTVNPTAAGASTLSATYTLPAGALQAVRGVFRFNGAAAACTLGQYDDHDDLVFATQ